MVHLFRVAHTWRRIRNIHMERLLVALFMATVVTASLYDDEHLIERYEQPLGGIVHLTETALQRPCPQLSANSEFATAAANYASSFPAAAHPLKAARPAIQRHRPAAQHVAAWPCQTASADEFLCPAFQGRRENRT